VVIKAVPVKIYQGGDVDCLDNECPHSRKCGNHYSAGEFRSEDGETPLLTIEKLSDRAGITGICEGLSGNSLGGLHYKDGHLKSWADIEKEWDATV
jgi:hypothetical protein